MQPNRWNPLEASNQVCVGLVRGVAPPDGEVAGLAPPMRSLNVCAGRSELWNGSGVTREREPTATGIDPTEWVGDDGDWENAVEWVSVRATHATTLVHLDWGQPNLE
jgi:hypothetical protein